MAWEGQEKRRFPRAVFLCKIAVGYPLRWLTSHTENVSVGGIRVFLEEKLSTFTPASLEIYFEKTRPIKCKGRVIWVKEKLNPLERQPVMFDIGIEFTEIKESDQEYINKLVEILLSQEKNNKLRNKNE